MKCVLCKNGETKPGKVTTTLQRDETVIVVKEVPADVCENCGEYYISHDITGQLLSKAEEAVKKGVEIEVFEFVA